MRRGSRVKKKEVLRSPSFSHSTWEHCRAMISSISNNSHNLFSTLLVSVIMVSSIGPIRRNKSWRSNSPIFLRTEPKVSLLHVWSDLATECKDAQVLFRSTGPLELLVHAFSITSLYSGKCSHAASKRKTYFTGCRVASIEREPTEIDTARWSELVVITLSTWQSSNKFVNPPFATARSSHTLTY
jgi:hypothetical protein